MSDEEERQQLQEGLQGAQQLLGVFKGLKASEAILRTLAISERKADEIVARIEKGTADLLALNNEIAEKQQAHAEAQAALKEKADQLVLNAQAEANEIMMQAQASAEALKEAAQSDADAIKGLVASQKAELGNLASQIVAKRAEHVAITEKLDTARAAMQKLLSS